MVKASVIWLNYNSIKFLDITLKSLHSVLNLDFNDYELIIVDNASNDGSFEQIKKYVEKMKPGNVTLKIVRSDENLGYAGGMNLGWKARDADSKYVAFVNNDLIAFPESLSKIIEYMEASDTIGAASGLLYRDDEGRIYSAGCAVDEILTALPICGGLTPGDCPTAKKPQIVTYADGAYYVARVDLIKKHGFNGLPFINETFLYADDSLLSIRLWNFGFSSYYLPIEAGIHYASSTTKRTGQISYYPIRAKFIAYNLIKTKHYNLIPIYYTRINVSSLILCKAGFKQYCTLYKAAGDGWKIGKILKKKYGTLGLAKVPRVKVSWPLILTHIIFPVRSTLLRNKRRFITHNDLEK